MNEAIYPDQFKLFWEQEQFDFAFICSELQQTYWAAWHQLTDVKTSFNNSLAVMIYQGSGPVDFARVISDYVPDPQTNADYYCRCSRAVSTVWF